MPWFLTAGTPLATPHATGYAQLVTATGRSPGKKAMTFRDYTDKLAIAEDYLMHAPLYSREWEAAREHVSWALANAADDAQRHAAQAVISRVARRRPQPGLAERLGALTGAGQDAAPARGGDGSD